MDNTLYSIQLLRFVAAYLVVMMHASQAIALRMSSAPDDYWKFGSFGVDIFFVISGFVMEFLSKENKVSFRQRWLDSLKFLKRRFIRIVPLYWIYTSLKILVLVMLPFLAARTSFDAYHIFSSYLFIPAKAPWGLMEPFLPVGWTLNFEMFFYFVFAISLLLGLHRLFSVLLLFALIFICASIFNNEILFFYSRDIIFEFVAGMVVATCYKRKWLIRNHSVSCLILIASILYLYLCYSLDLDLIRLFRWGVPATLLVYSLLSLEQVIRRNTGVLKIAVYGDTSYTTYLLHTFVVPAVPMLLLHLGLTSRLFALAGCLILTFILSNIGYFLFEKQLIARLKLFIH